MRWTQAEEPLALQISGSAVLAMGLCICPQVSVHGRLCVHALAGFSGNICLSARC